MYMKELAIGIFLLIVVGVGGFLYNNAKNNSGGENQGPIACTMDAKMCPAGWGVGRVAPDCSFAMCPSEKFTYNAPEGYQDTTMLLSSTVEGRLAFYTREPNTISNNITVFVYPKGDQTLEDVVTERLINSPSGMPVESLDEFEQVVVGNNTAYRKILERFEATVQIVYVVDLADIVVVVSHTDISVENWMEDFTLEELEDLPVLEDVVASIQYN